MPWIQTSHVKIFSCFEEALRKISYWVITRRKFGLNLVGEVNYLIHCRWDSHRPPGFLVLLYGYRTLQPFFKMPD